MTQNLNSKPQQGLLSKSGKCIMSYEYELEKKNFHEKIL